jgi:hypothetical protein
LHEPLVECGKVAAYRFSEEFHANTGNILANRKRRILAAVFETS